MTEPSPVDVPARAASADRQTFLYRLAIVTLSVLLFDLVIKVLRDFRVILQPLFIAVFIGYLIMPVHRWLVLRGIPSVAAYISILVIVLGSLFGVGTMVFRNVDQLSVRLPEYERNLDKMLSGLVQFLPWEMPEAEEGLLRGILKANTSDQTLTGAVQRMLGNIFDFFTALAVTFIYLIFLVAERISFPRRIALAFGETQGQHVMEVIAKINNAIAQYISVKTFVSFVAGVWSTAVLAIFSVDFYLMWGMLIFLLNFIPYLGSLVAVALPIMLSFVQFDVAWKGFVIAGCLIAIQQLIGTFIEPRMAGSKLGVSPLLILLALSFWGVVWGIIGMILAVPLLMIAKIVLDNIQETKPVGTLLSNL